MTKKTSWKKGGSSFACLAACHGRKDGKLVAEVVLRDGAAQLYRAVGLPGIDAPRDGFTWVNAGSFSDVDAAKSAAADFAR